MNNYLYNYYERRGLIQEYDCSYSDTIHALRMKRLREWVDEELRACRLNPDRFLLA